MALTETSIVQRERENNFGFAIPAPDVVWIANQLRTRGRVDRAYLGVRLEPVSAADSIVLSDSDQRPGRKAIAPRSDATPELATQIAVDSDEASTAFIQEGAILSEVLAGTPAAEAGLLPGDGIIALDGQPIRSALDLTDRLDRIPARTTIALSVIRSRGSRQQRISLSLRTASRPELRRLAAPGSPAAIPVSASLPSTVPNAITASLRMTTPASPTKAASAPDSLTRRVNEPQLILPRAVVERLEQLERRLQAPSLSPLLTHARPVTRIAKVVPRSQSITTPSSHTAPAAFPHQFRHLIHARCRN